MMMIINEESYMSGEPEMYFTHFDLGTEFDEYGDLPFPEVDEESLNKFDKE